MEARHTLSEDGKNWLEKALDPFHDFEIDVRGQPDADTSRVLIEEINQSLQITAPANQTAPWDAHIYTLPVVTGVSTGFQSSGTTLLRGGIQRVAMQTAGNLNTGGTGVEVYPAIDNTLCFIGTQPRRPLTFLNCDSFAVSGSPLAPTRSASYAAPSAVHVLDGGASQIVGRRRLIAAGFEIHDTTAPLYKQGTLTVYRMPQAEAISMAVSDISTNNAGAAAHAPGQPYYGSNASTLTLGTDNLLTAPVGSFPFKVYNCPPSSLALAMNYPGTRQWEAKDGVYVALTQDAARNILRYDDDAYFAYTDGDYSPSVIGGNTIARPTSADSWALPSWSVVTTPVLDVGGDAVQDIGVTVAATNFLQVPFHTSGVMLTGLNPNSTFTITLKALWEVAPVTGDATGNLVPLSKPSPGYDPIALELYQRAVGLMPTGMKVDMNAAGDFWDWTLKALSVAATPIATALMGPGGSAVGLAATKGIDVMRQKRNERAALQDKANRTISEFKADSMPSLNEGMSSMAVSKKKKKKQVLDHAPLTKNQKKKLKKAGNPFYA